MMEHDRARLIKSIKRTLRSMDSDARCFCYSNEPEYTAIVNCLKDYITLLEGRSVEEVVRYVAGSMALSGMELTEEDKERLRLAKDPKRVEEIVGELVRKHTSHE